MAYYIETLEDVVEYLANRIGIYGAHIEFSEHSNVNCACRPCWTSRVRHRIEAAIEIERKMNNEGITLKDIADTGFRRESM